MATASLRATLQVCRIWSPPLNTERPLTSGQLKSTIEPRVFFAEQAKLDATARERECARTDREGAIADRERARLRRELLRLPAPDT